jgi:hypothetical protein
MLKKNKKGKFVRSYAKYLKLHHACVIMNAIVKRRTNNEKPVKKKSGTSNCR